MTPTDAMALRKLREYRKERGKLPEYLEVTEEILEQMDYRAFLFPVFHAAPAIAALTQDAPASPVGHIEQIRVPVVLIGDYVMTENNELKLEVKS